MSWRVVLKRVRSFVLMYASLHFLSFFLSVETERKFRKTRCRTRACVGLFHWEKEGNGRKERDEGRGKRERKRETEEEE